MRNDLSPTEEMLVTARVIAGAIFFIGLIVVVFTWILSTV